MQETQEFVILAWNHAAFASTFFFFFFFLAQAWEKPLKDSISRNKPCMKAIIGSEAVSIHMCNIMYLNTSLYFVFSQIRSITTKICFKWIYPFTHKIVLL